MKELGIYVHIPFCKSKCKYCDFNSYQGLDNLQHDYLKSLIKEFKVYSLKLKNCAISTIFIGGGTPSFMFSGAISTIISELRKNYNVLPNAEITIESNPNSITYSKALEWIGCGVNRVSVGLQSSKQNLLKIIGRCHTKQDYIKAIEVLKSAGFNNINTDVMLGLPRQKMSDLRSTLKLAFKLGSKHISVYSLILEENTPLFDEVEKGIIKLPNEKKVVSMMLDAEHILSNYGYKKYEVSNFSFSGYECKHNLNCWNMQEYIGFGAGAHSFFEKNRWENVLQVEKYISIMKSGKNPAQNITVEKNEDLLEETIMLGLRLKKGLNLSKLNKKFDINFLESKNSEVNELKNFGFVEIVDGYLRATSKGFLFLNKIIEKLV